MITEILFCDPILRKKISHNNIICLKDNDELNILVFPLCLKIKKQTDNQKERPQLPMFKINLLTLYGAKEGKLYGKIWNHLWRETKIRKP